MKYYTKVLKDNTMRQLNSKYKIAQGDYELVYRVVDIDKDGTPELIVGSDPYEGARLTYLFTVQNGRLKCCGGYRYYFSYVYAGDTPGIVVSTIDGRQLKLTLKRGELKEEDVSDRTDYPSAVPAFDAGLMFQVAYPVK